MSTVIFIFFFIYIIKYYSPEFTALFYFFSIQNCKKQKRILVIVGMCSKCKDLYKLDYKKIFYYKVTGGDRHNNVDCYNNRSINLVTDCLCSCSILATKEIRSTFKFSEFVWHLKCFIFY